MYDERIMILSNFY